MADQLRTRYQQSDLGLCVDRHRVYSDRRHQGQLPCSQAVTLEKQQLPFDKLRSLAPDILTLCGDGENVDKSFQFFGIFDPDNCVSSIRQY